MKILIPGSFDPPTNGHIDVIKRCSKIFTEILVGVVVNPSKESLFSREERSSMLEEIFKDYTNIKVMSFEGLLVDFASKNSVDAIVKGLRAMTDFDYEFQMAGMNKRLNTEIETVFLMASETNQFIASRFVKEVASLGGDVSSFVPENVNNEIIKKFNLIK